MTPSVGIPTDPGYFGMTSVASFNDGLHHTCVRPINQSVNLPRKLGVLQVGGLADGASLGRDHRRPFRPRKIALSFVRIVDSSKQLEFNLWRPPATTVSPRR